MLRDIIRSIFRRPAQDEVNPSSNVTGLLMVAGTIALLIWWYDRVNTVRWELLQQLLQLPTGIERSHFIPSSTDKTYEELRRGTAEATFSDEQFRLFMEVIDNRTARTIGPGSVNRVTVVSYSPRALVWTPPPLPKRVGSWTPQVAGLHSAADPSADQRVFCLVFQDPRAWNDPSPRLVYLAKSCSELSPEDDPTIVVMAVIDVATRTMRISVE